MLLALVAVVAGVYFGFFATRGFESTTGTIVRIEEDEGGILTKVPFPGILPHLDPGGTAGRHLHDRFHHRQDGHDAVQLTGGTKLWGKSREHGLS